MAIDTSKVSKLGFGMMRLPEVEGKIDLPQVCAMVDKFIEAGFNYFDTAYVYHSGLSEVAAREALVKRYPRDSFYLATKLPAWEMKGQEDNERIFQEQLERCGVEYFDFYLLHSIEDGSNHDTYEAFGSWDWAKAKKEAGQIRHLGFSFHGSPALLEDILDRHPEVEFVQIQLNYADWTNPLIRSGQLYQILHERNIPMIIMEPVKGGTLANLPEQIATMYKECRPDKSIASWALRFVGSLPGIMTILSGMSNEAQMEDNLSTFKNFEPLSEEESALVEKASEIWRSIPQIGCTACRYCCDGCPMQINIPEIFRAENTLRIYPDDWRAKGYYQTVTEAGGKPADCIGCGQCESVCPQHLPIIELLQEISAKY